MAMLLEALKSYDFEYLLTWMRSNWTLSLYISLVYVIAIFWGQSYMKHRAPLNLRPALFIWSLCLALFSCFGAYRTFAGIWNDAQENGWLYTMCSLSYLTDTGNNNTAFWAFLFMFSKLPELGDTVFIVLRKQRLIFLHWYHHITVFVYCWYSYGNPVATGRWFSAINYLVHAIMYSYYALRATGNRTPKFIPVCITSLQIAQMVAGISVNLYALKMQYSNESCYVEMTHIVLSLSMYTSYFVLFCNFFFKTYFGRNKKLDKVKVESEANKKAIKEEEKRQFTDELRKRKAVKQDGV